VISISAVEVGQGSRAIFSKIGEFLSIAARKIQLTGDTVIYVQLLISILEDQVAG